MKAKLQTWAWCMVLIVAMAIACEPIHLLSAAEPAQADPEYHLIDHYGDIEFIESANRRIYPPAQVHWAPPTADPETIGGSCYTTGALVEVTRDQIVLVQSQWIESGYVECDIQIPWTSVIAAVNYETHAEIVRPRWQ